MTKRPNPPTLLTMHGLEWDGSRLAVVDRPVPTATDDLAVVRVTLAGICNTDLEIAKGYMGFRGILGHEFVGVVESGPAGWLGRRVVGEINFACQTCDYCRRGLGRHCPTRTVMGILGADGAIAEYVAVPVANLHTVPDSISDDVAVFAEPLAAAFEVLEQVAIEPGIECTVLGDGKLGLLIAQVLHQAGAKVTAVGKHNNKLALLRRHGICAVRFDDWNRAANNLVVEATGSAEGFAMALAATRPRGTLVLKSTVAGNMSLNLAPVVINEISIVGSRCGSFPPAVEGLARGIDVVSLISDRFALNNAVAALRRASEPGVLKVLIDPLARV